MNQVKVLQFSQTSRIYPLNEFPWFLHENVSPIEDYCQIFIKLALGDGAVLGAKENGNE